MGTTFRLFWTNEAVLILYGGVISVSTWAVTLRQIKERSIMAIDFIGGFCSKVVNIQIIVKAVCKRLIAYSLQSKVTLK